MSDERTAWIALAGVDGVGPVTFERLVNRYGGAAAALAVAADGRAGERFTADGVRVPVRVAAGIAAAARDPEAIAARLRALDGWALTPLDPGWPVTLDRIAEPPPVLFGRGDPGSLTADAIAIVGTRHPTARGIHATELIAAVATELGIAVVSGLALGIDIAAHAAVLDRGGVTVGVSGGGLARGWPRRNERTAAGMVAGSGAIVTELAPGSAATVGTFPRRNRIIAGLASRTIVIEAPVGSGSLITARHALAHGRPVAVVTGPPGARTWAGGAALTGESPAAAVTLEELVASLACHGGPGTAGSSAGAPDDPGAATGAPAAAMPDPLGMTEAALAGILARGPLTADGAAVRLGIGAGAAAATFLMLQLRGWARPWGGVWLPAGPLLTSPARDGPLLRPEGRMAGRHRSVPGAVACTGDP